MSEPVLAEAIGVIDGINTDFETPSPYITGTLYAYLNGVLIRSSDYNGPIELGGNSVRMKVPPVLGPTPNPDTLHFYYDTEPPIGGGFYGPPRMMSALNLVPSNLSANNLSPNMISSENDNVENLPIIYNVVNLKPKMSGVIDLKPKMISAEEM